MHWAGGSEKRMAWSGRGPGLRKHGCESLLWCLELYFVMGATAYAALDRLAFFQGGEILDDRENPVSYLVIGVVIQD